MSQRLRNRTWLGGATRAYNHPHQHEQQGNEMKKTHRGSCHCGAIRFEVELDLAEETSKCNCSICSKARFWKSIVPAASFRLVLGEDALREYTFGGRNIRHFFCGTCGVKPFGRGHLDEIGDFYAINVMSLDDATDEELARAPVVYQDGRDNRWDRAPAETRHL
jgi:hypothetical protein